MDALTLSALVQALFAVVLTAVTYSLLRLERQRDTVRFDILAAQEVTPSKYQVVIANRGGHDSAVSGAFVAFAAPKERAVRFLDTRDVRRIDAVPSGGSSSLLLRAGDIGVYEIQTEAPPAPVPADHTLQIRLESVLGDSVTHVVLTDRRVNVWHSQEGRFTLKKDLD